MNLTREILPDLETQEDDTMFQGQQRIIQEERPANPASCPGW